jgi:hypothetical protein
LKIELYPYSLYKCRSHRTDGCTGVKGLEHVLYGHVPTWLTRAPGLLISSLRVPDAYRPTSSIPILALFASLSPFISRVYSTALLFKREKIRHNQENTPASVQRPYPPWYPVVRLLRIIPLEYSSPVWPTLT